MVLSFTVANRNLKKYIKEIEEAVRKCAEMAKTHYEGYIEFGISSEVVERMASEIFQIELKEKCKRIEKKYLGKLMR